MELGLYVHPFAFAELEPLGGVAALPALGIGEVAVAAAYHAGRWLVPGARDRIVRFLEDGVVHFAPGARYDGIVPKASAPSGGRSLLADSCAEAGRHGVRVAAWSVLFHNTRLGTLHPDACVENAFGERYEYALCPRREEVRAYGTRLAAEIAATPGLAALELEAVGWMGHKHGSHHDKSSFGTDAHADFLLSYCFCSACAVALQAIDVDAAAVRARVRELLRARFHDGDAMHEAPRTREALAEDLGKATLSGLLEARRRGNEDLLRRLRSAIGPRVRLGVHLEPDPFFTGSQLGLELDRVAPLVDEVVLTRYGETPERIESSLAGLAFPDGLAVRLALWPRAPAFRTEADLVRIRKAALARRLTGLRIYHAGLLPVRTLRRAAAALAENALA